MGNSAAYQEMKLQKLQEWNKQRMKKYVKLKIEEGRKQNQRWNWIGCG